MLLLLEIVLTIVTWFRGWKWYALIPILSVLVIGLTMGFIFGVLGYDVIEISNQKWVNVFDILAVAALAVMIVNPPKEKDD